MTILMNVFMFAARLVHSTAQHHRAIHHPVLSTLLLALATRPVRLHTHRALLPTALNETDGPQAGRLLI